MLGRFWLATFVTLSIAWAFPCLAVELIAVEFGKSEPQVILPVADDESPAQAIERYWQSMQDSRTSPMMAAQLRSEQIDPPAATRVRFLKDIPKTSRVRTVLLANIFADMIPNQPRILNAKASFSEAGSETFVLAMAADRSLSPEDAKDYRRKVARNFNLMVGLGGADIAPEVYGQALTSAVDTNPERDASELAMVQTFIEEAFGIYFGICRGHHMGAIASGAELDQDMTDAGVASSATHGNFSRDNRRAFHAGNWHDGISLDVKYHEIVVLDSLLARFLGGPGVYRVNSYHHQDVMRDKTGALFAIALHEDGVIEGLQSWNRRVITVQFHPELARALMSDPDFRENSQKIIRGVVAYARLVRMRDASVSQLLCPKLFD